MKLYCCCCCWRWSTGLVSRGAEMTDWQTWFPGVYIHGWVEQTRNTHTHKDRYPFHLFLLLLLLVDLFERGKHIAYSLSIFFCVLLSRLSVVSISYQERVFRVSITLSLLLRWIRQAPCLPFVSAVVDGSSSSFSFFFFYLLSYIYIYFYLVPSF